MKQYHYEEVNRPKRSKFDLSHEKKMTMDVGYLYPCYVQEVIPGDQFSLSQEILLRNMPLIAPMMHRVNVFTHFFYVPNRVVFPNWDKFVMQAETMNLPKLTGSGANWAGNGVGSLCDYLGLPVTEFANLGTGSLNISSLPFRAYQQIFNDYYRDQNLDNEVEFDKSELDQPITGTDGIALSQIRTRNLEKDYFTSALPNTQFGDPVTLPIGTTAPIQANGNIQFKGQHQPTPDWQAGPVNIHNQGYFQAQEAGAGIASMQYVSGLEVDLTNATSASVNDWRRAMALQRFKEKLMRGGRRFNEFILNIFGVKVQDSRLQRAEYLGGGKLPLQISEVIQTYGASDTETPLGNLAGHGVAGGHTTGFSTFIPEHGYIMGIMSILPKTGYFQGIPRHFIKFSHLEYYIPDFAHIGEQAVLNEELYLDGNEIGKTFGYSPRYSEYRDNPDTIHGEFRTTLLHWHCAKKYANQPQLNSSFIKPSLTDFNRIFATQSVGEGKFLVQTYLRISAIRPISKFGNPI